MLYADVNSLKFTSEHDGLEVHGIIAVPTAQVSGIVQIVHDIWSNKEQYLPLMEYLAEQGFLTVIHDARGHGQSIREPNDLGFMYKEGDVGFVRDIHQLHGIVRAANPSLPYFMIGQGIGALGVLAFAKQYDSMLCGAILIGLPCYSRFSRFSLNVDRELAKKSGAAYRSEKSQAMLKKVLMKPFSKEKTENAWLCSDKNVVAEFNADPGRNFVFTLGGFSSLLYLSGEVYSRRGWRLENPSLPLRLLSGRDDMFMLSEKKFAKAINHIEKVGYESITWRFFDGMRHDILHEPERDTVYKDIAKSLFSWIDRLER